MTSSLDLHGIFPAIPTPFGRDGAIEFEALRENLARWHAEPFAGYVVGGSNGEFVLLTDDERVAVVGAARQAIPSGRLLLAGAGAQSTARTLSLAERMADEGADALLVVTPSYYRGLMSVEVLVEHYEAVADASSVPVVLYNVPASTGLNMPIEAIVQLVEHPNIIGMKDSSGELVRLAEIVERTPDDFQLLAGSGSFLLPALAVGAVGAVGVIAALANIAARPLHELITSFESGDRAKAQALQANLLAPNLAVTAQFGVPGLKAALDMLGYYGGPPRRPLLPLAEEEKEQVAGVLRKAGLLDA